MIAPVTKLAQWCIAALLVQGLWLLPGRAVAQPPDSLIIQAHKAVSRALGYFSTPGRIPDRDAVLLHAYLKDRFRLPALHAADSVLAQIRSDPKNQYYKFLRLAGHRPCELGFLDVDGANDLALAGVWYDELPEPSLLMDRIKGAELAEPYTATHALWALAMAKNCFQAVVDTAVEKRVVARTLEIMATHRPLWDDVAIEAVAVAQYHDSCYVPPRSYIKEIIDLQNPDGSWNWVPHDKSRASQHTTSLALWALLQYKPMAIPVMPREMVVR